MAKDSEPAPRKLIAQNRKARHDYTIEDTLEAGIVLAGSEVKALRSTGASIMEAYAGERGGELWLFNAYIAEYSGANRLNHEPKRPRKLLVHARERARLIGLVKREGVTLVPLQLYFNKRGIAKIELGLAHGRKKADRREAIKQRDWNREKARLLRTRNRAA